MKQTKVIATATIVKKLWKVTVKTGPASYRDITVEASNVIQAEVIARSYGEVWRGPTLK